LILLNKGLVSNPTEHSIATYGLHYDDEKKQWVSDLVEKTNVVKIHVKKSSNEDIKESTNNVDRVTRSKTKATFGEGKSRKPNAWLEYVKTIQKDNPELTYKEILNLASISYKKGSRYSSNSSLTL
jgi:ABC-type Fe3+/spermidine/putrescine transport system ATPase subunit